MYLGRRRQILFCAKIRIFDCVREGLICGRVGMVRRTNDICCRNYLYGVRDASGKYAIFFCGLSFALLGGPFLSECRGMAWERDEVFRMLFFTFLSHYSTNPEQLAHSTLNNHTNSHSHHNKNFLVFISLGLVVVVVDCQSR